MKLTNKIIRQISFKEQNKKQNCYICNKYKEISELHHLIEVSDLSKLLPILVDNDKQMAELIKGLWLCPNHHAIYHKMQCYNNIGMLLQLNDKEVKKYENLYKYVSELYKQAFIILGNANIEKITRLEIEKELSDKRAKISYTLKKIHKLVK